MQQMTQAIFLNKDEITIKQGGVSKLTPRGYCNVLYSDELSVAPTTGKVPFVVPTEFNNWSIGTLIAAVGSAKGITGQTTYRVRRRRAGVDTNIISVAVGDEWFKVTQVTNNSDAKVLTGDQIFIDILSTHTTAPVGFAVSVMFKQVK